MARKKKKFKNTDKRYFMFISLIVAICLMVLLMPKSPMPRAINSQNTLMSTDSSTVIGLKISEVMTDNNSAFPDEKGEFSDWIELWNASTNSISMIDMGLSDREDKVRFLFPNVTLEPDERIVVYCDDINNSTVGQTYHAKFKLSSYGDGLFLFDSNGFVIDSLEIPTLNSNECYALNAETNMFEVSSDYSPLYPNSFEGHRMYMDNFHIDADKLRINEIMPSPRSGLYDEDGELVEWIELYNAGDEIIELGKLALSDNLDNPLKWIFPQGTIINPGQHYIVFCSGKDKLELSTGIPHTNFGIKSEGETILLSTISGQLVDRVTVPNIGYDKSFGLDPDTKEWIIFHLSTPKLPNTKESSHIMDEYLRMTNPSGVYISEILANADTVAIASGEDQCDWVELYNSTANTVDLSLYGLSDNVNWPRKWRFPTGTTIKPNEYKVIRLDEQLITTDNEENHTAFSLSADGQEVMTLSDPNGRVLDRLYFPEMKADISYGRSNIENGFFFFSVPTPGRSNEGGFLGHAKAPSFVQKGGLYKGTIQVALDVPSNTSVRYTLDGSVPTIDNSFLYENPIELSQTTVIRARGFSGSLHPSDTISATYVMNTYFDLPVVSLICDPVELWDENTGLYAPGPNIDKTVFPFENATYREHGKTGRPGYLEIFGLDGEAMISQGIKMELMGDYSLDMPQKSWKVRAQSNMGEKYFNYPLFEDREYTYYKSLTFRNSGNDNSWTRIADGLQSKLMDTLDTRVLHLAWKPVLVYLNGDFWGHYNMRERKDRFSIAQHEGISMDDADNMTILRGNSSVVQGSNAEYREMISKIKTMSPGTNPDDLQYIVDNVDVDNYFEWFAIEMFFGNSDIGNFMFYKLDGEGNKWKTILFDLDYGLFKSSFNSPWSFLKPNGMGEKLINNTIFLKLLEEPGMRDKFLSYLAHVYKTLTPQVMLAQLNACVNEIEPVLDLHFDRWAPYTEKIINSESPKNKDGAYRYWVQRVERMKDTINRRHYMLYGFIQEQFKLSNDEMNYYFGTMPPKPD